MSCRELLSRSGGLACFALIIGWLATAEEYDNATEEAEMAKPPVVAARTAKLTDIATDKYDPHNLADYEPSIAVNPKNPKEIAVLTFSGGWDPDDPKLMAPIWKSRDGGKTWVKIHQLPYPEQGREGPADQSIGFDHDGKIFVAAMASGARPRCFIYRQGAKPDDPLQPGRPYGDDQPFLAIDIAKASPGFKRIYSPWLDQRQVKHASMVSMSSDQGRTVAPVPLGANTQHPNRSTRLAIGPKGVVYVVCKTREKGMVGGFEEAHFVVRRSDDFGKTWTALGKDGVSVHGAAPAITLFTRAFGNSRKGKVAPARSSDAWIAVHADKGTVYVAHVHKDRSAYSQIYVARSTDRGTTWKSSRVTAGLHHAGYPEIAVAENGTVGVLYIDYDDSGVRTIFRHHFARSFDDGATWNSQLLQEMEPSKLANAAGGVLWGDYEGLTAHKDTFFGVFTGESIGRTPRQLDPIFFVETAVPPK